MNKIMITGANGFTGIHLQNYLRGEKIIPVDRIFSEESKGIEINLLNRNQVLELIEKEKPDSIIHLVGISRSDNYEDIYTSNDFTTINLLDSVLKNNLTNTRILLISSSAVYGNPLKPEVSESMPINPINHYGNSKLLVEKLAQQYIQKFGLHICIARTFNLIGPRQTDAFVLPSFLIQLLKIKYGKQEPVIYTGDLSAKRDFIFIDDAIQAYWLLLNKGQIGECYNIGSGYSISIYEILQKMIQLIGVTCQIKTDKDRIQTNQIHNIYANTKKINQLGWNNQTSLEQALNKMIEYYSTIVELNTIL